MEFKRGKEEKAEKGRFSDVSPPLIYDLLSFKFFTKNVSAEEPDLKAKYMGGHKGG